MVFDPSVSAIFKDEPVLYSSIKCRKPCDNVEATKNNIMHCIRSHYQLEFYIFFACQRRFKKILFSKFNSCIVIDRPLKINASSHTCEPIQSAIFIDLLFLEYYVLGARLCSKPVFFSIMLQKCNFVFIIRHIFF